MERCYVVIIELTDLKHLMIIGSPKGLGNYNQKRGLMIKGLT